MNRLALRLLMGLAWFALANWQSTQAREHRTIPGHVPAAVARLQPVAAVSETNRLQLVLSLPLHHPEDLTALIGQLSDPTSTNYHRWLTPEQFNQRFGPTAEEYQAVLEFARTNGLQITGRWTNRMLVDVEAPVGNIQKAFQIKLHQYAHPTEPRQFYAPDADPVVDTNIPLLHVRGLDDFIRPYRLGGHLKPVPLATDGITANYTGSGPGGNFMGKDFRAAYAPGVTNTGAGQYIAVIDVGGPYYTNDIYQYEIAAGLPTNLAVTNVVLSGWTGVPVGTNQDDGEEALDICMALAMAPGAVVLNYEGNGADIFNRIASDNLARQMTLSYGFGIDAGIMQSFQQFLAQGQAMSQASGDGDADLNGGTGLTGNPYATIVGGTTLSTSGAGGPWSAETAWNWGNNGGSGGGISGYGVPNWQQGLAMSANLGSTNYRNYPDVSMPADGVYLIFKNGMAAGTVGGTSCASPLWAGFMALVNQQAAALGKPAIGFANPPIYALGKGPRSTYTNCFHDIATGNNFNSQNPTRFPAVTGYDLCTGWGTPTGSNTLAALAGSGTNDFTFYASPDRVSLVRGGAATSVLAVTRLNGYAGTVTFTVTGVPAGVTAAVSPVTTSTTALLTLTATSASALGTNLITLTGTSGALVHAITLTLAVTAPLPGAVAVTLTGLYNRAGLWTDGRTFSGGLDAGGYAYSANLVGTTPSWNGLVFTLGPANANDVISCAGQTVTLPAGNFTSLQILGTAVNGSQPAQTFIVTYTDNATTTNVQSFSDWANPQRYAGEAVVVPMGYRNNGGGAKDLYTAVNLYGYNLTLNQTKTVKSVTLPNNANVEMLALALANEPVSAPLAGNYNRPGLYTDGTTFTNPATGGIDGGGAAYSASLLGGSQTWTNMLFNFGPANVTNVISATNQTINLPAGNFAFLRMLGSAVQGSQASQTFTVNYTDGISSAFVQSLSDWFSPQGYAGEVPALPQGHRNSSDGTADNRTFNLYGYGFKLNATKVVQSLKLPANPNVILLAISLAPVLRPVIITLPVASPITYGQSLGNATLSGGVASVAGSFVFTTAATTPGVGTAAQSVTFMPTDSTDYANVVTNVNVTVNPAPPVITWTNPAALVYGGALGTNQLNATSSTPGTLAYSPPAGTVPGAGTNTLTVICQPTDTVNYFSVTSTVSLLVQPAPLSVTANNAVRGYGTTNPVFSGTLSGLQNGDNISARYASPATLNSPAGTYAIVPTLVDPAGRLTNYLVALQNGTLTVTNPALTFSANPFTEPAVVAGQMYAATLAAQATGASGAALTFTLASGPAWLNLAPAGDLSGTPLSMNVGTNTFGVSVRAADGRSNSATFYITVRPAPPIVPSISSTPTNLWLNWSGGIAPFQVQMATKLAGSNWVNASGVLRSNTLLLQPAGPAAFYRIVGQ